MFNFGSLRFRIFAIVGCICAIMLTTALVGYFGLTSSLASFRDYRAIESHAASIREIDTDVQELRRRVGQYVVTGSSSQENAIRTTLKQLSEKISLQLNEPRSSENHDHLQRMAPHVQKYQENFDLVVEERKIRTDVSQIQLPQQASDIQQDIDRISSELVSRGDNMNLVVILSAQQSFLLAQRNALRYFAAPDSLLAQETITAFQQANDQLNQASFEDIELEQQFNALREKLSNNERLTYRAIQATRAYLYLTNVVMAGEASEIIWHASRLKENADQDRMSITQATTQQAQFTNWLTITVLCIATVAAIIAALSLARSTLRPISAITDTFAKLADGETLETIPGRDRNDEIGDMAKAAEIFSKMNQQTELLLADSQKMSRELIAKSEELKVINNELDNFAYVASHDLKSPLRGIQQLAQWVQEDGADVLPESSIDHLDRLMGRIDKMNRLLEELLEYSRVGRTKAQPEKVNVRTLLEDAVELLDNPAGINIRLVGDFPNMQTLRAPLSQVLQNLLANAIKYNHRGADGWVEVQHEEQNGWHMFSVADNGPGIAAKYHTRIFQMYQRVDNSGAEGTGMGLAIVKRQVEAMGGKIRVESEIEQGAKFEFTWPDQLPAPADAEGEYATATS